MKEYIFPFIYMLIEMAPYLLLGFFIAGILHSFIPQKVYRKWLSGNDVKSVLLSIIFGVPLPLCSCGVIPTAVSMYKQGASKGATTAFLIATPQTGIDSIAATWSILGLPFAILRPIAAMVTGFVGGVIENHQSKNDSCIQTECQTDKKPEGESIGSKFISALKYGFSEMIQDIGLWLIIGLIIAGLITIFVPDDFFMSYSNNRIVNMLLILLVSIPMYVCATGSIPIAAALILKGLNPGAALVFLMAGPATNAASMMVLGKTLGKRSLITFLATIIIGAISFGLIVDCFLPTEWFVSQINQKFQNSACMGEGNIIPWWKSLSAIILTILLIIAMKKRLTRNKKETLSYMKSFNVSGMMCNHCKAHVENAIKALDGVKSVNIDLASGKTDVEGDVPASAIIDAVKKIGYECLEN